MISPTQTSNAPSGKVRSPIWRAWLVPILFVLAWGLLYSVLEPTMGALTRLLPIEVDSRLYSATRFFLFEVPKVLMLLTLVVFVVGVVQSFFTPQKTRAILAGKRQAAGSVLAAVLGVVTPFCSCSAVPMFIGFLTAGVPLGVTFSFLVSAPMVNEVALALLLGMFGWKIAALYLGLGLAISIVSGLVIGHMNPVQLVEPWVFDMSAVDPDEVGLDWTQRFAQGWRHVREIVIKVAPYIVAGGGWERGFTDTCQRTSWPV